MQEHSAVAGGTHGDAGREGDVRHHCLDLGGGGGVRRGGLLLLILRHLAEVYGRVRRNAEHQHRFLRRLVQHLRPVGRGDVLQCMPTIMPVD